MNQVEHIRQNIRNEIHSALILSCSKGKILSINKNAEKLYGYNKSEMTGHSIEGLFYDKADFRRVQDALDKTGEFNGVIIQLLKTNSSIICYLSGVQYQDQNTGQDLWRFHSRDVCSIKEIVEQYFHIVHNALDVIFSTDYNGNFTYVNPRVKKLLGYSSSELIGESINKVIDFKWKDFVNDYYFTMFKTKQKESILEFMATRKDGVSIWIEQTVSTTFDPTDNSRILGYEGVVRNIDKRKEMEIKIAENEQNLRDIFDNSSELILKMDMIGKIIFVNKTWENTMKFSKIESVEKNFFDVVSPKSRKHCWEILISVKNENFEFNSFANFSLMNSDGEIVEIQSAISLNKRFGQPESIQFFMRNISENKKAKLRLDKSEQNFKRITSTISDVFYLFDIKQDKIEFISPNFQEIFGISSKKLKGDMTLIENIIHPEDLTIVTYMNTKVRKGIAGDIEYRINYKNEIRWIQERTFPVFDEDRNVEGVSGVISDITKRKKQTAQLDQQKNANENSLLLAKKIQKAILSNKSLVSELFPHHFLYFKPKVDLSGIFYHIHEIRTNDKKSLYVLILGDTCETGIAAPMLSILTSSILRDATTRKEINSPAEALKTLHSKMDDLFLESNAEGYSPLVQIGFAVINPENNQMTYSGAKQDLLVKRNQEIIKCKGDKFSIGNNDIKDIKFNITQITLKDGDQIFMLSEGLTAQIGGPLNKRLGTQHVLENIEKYNEINIRQNGAKIQKIFLDWKGKNEQNFDVCILGVQFKSKL
jgi:PAS domain S-box-containing protein